MEHYPAYRLEDFYYKSFREGGITLQQAHILFQHCQKREKDRLRFQGLLHGFDIDKESEEKPDKPKNKKQTSREFRKKFDEAQKKQSLPIFRDPSEYNNLSKEEKDKLTNKMMAQHKGWAKGFKNIGR